MKSVVFKCGNIDYKVAEMKTVIKVKITVAKNMKFGFYSIT
jgi:hypothetical protein